jgi:hypothetical protein
MCDILETGPNVSEERKPLMPVPKEKKDNVVSVTAQGRQEFRVSSTQRFLAQQKILDMNMTLADLSGKLGRDIDAVAGYVFAWDKYVYDVGLTLPRDTVSSRGAIRERSQRVLDLNTKLADLQQLAATSDLDRVAGYIYTEDKKTFIVASITDELVQPAV